MPVSSRLRGVLQLSAAVAVSALALSAQTSTPHTTGGIPMREEGHHHLVFANEYVNVFFVEIPAHETTLLHHHDFPYVSVPPGGADATSTSTEGPGGTSTPSFAHVAYALGNFSHTVTNSSDVTLRNIAVELVRPQGTVRNRCSAVLRDQPVDICQDSSLFAIKGSKHTPLLESDEILVDSWEIVPGARLTLKSDHEDVLLVGLTDVTVAGPPGIDSAHALRGGLLWVPAGSNPVFTTLPDRGGHFITIGFKDSAPAPH